MSHQPVIPLGGHGRRGHDGGRKKGGDRKRGGDDKKRAQIVWTRAVEVLEVQDARRF